MDEQKAYASDIAAEAVGERLGSPPPDTSEQTPAGRGVGGASSKGRGQDRGITWREVRRCVRGRHDERSVGAVAKSFSTRCGRVSDKQRGFIPVVRPTDLCHGPRGLRTRLYRRIVGSPPRPVAKSAMRGVRMALSFSRGRVRLRHSPDYQVDSASLASTNTGGIAPVPLLLNSGLEGLR
jgi:hypothetical protein